MSGYQFIREECYSKVQSQAAPTGKVGQARAADGGKLSARQVIAEAIRVDGAAPHVEAPKPPRCLYGKEAGELMTWYDELEAKAAEVRTTTAAGVEKRQRSDVPILMGVVASFPRKADDSDPEYVAWREETVRYLRERYGKNLVSIQEHTDENFGHVHSFVSRDGRSVKPLHAGFSASLKSAENGDAKKLQSIAYQEGGRAFQNDFFDRVASRVGLARLGPGKRRLTRKQWLAEQEAARALARANAKIKSDQQRIAEAKSAVRDEAQKLDQRAKKISTQADSVAAHEARVKAAEAIVVEAIPKIRNADIVLKNLAEEKAARDTAERKLRTVVAEKTELEHKNNVLHNETISLKRALRKAEP